MPTVWAGIDEAGYGPNLGPMVMTAVAARSDDDRPPDLWADLAATVDRAGGDPAKLWVDDSKAVYRAGQGRERLDAACRAALAEACARAGMPEPATFGALLDRVGAGGPDGAELTPWLVAGDPPFPTAPVPAAAARPLSGAPWRIVAVRSVVMGPARFNAGLARHGSKAAVHFEAFAGLLAGLWDLTGPAEPVRVRSDKHGGRHFYAGPLLDAFPDAWIDRGPEGPALSHYVLRQGPRRLEVSLQPRADADDGLVALASLVSKALREAWMDAWNRYWTGRVPGLRPTAGYPVDAARFRSAIAPLCAADGLAVEAWWRAK